MGLCWGVSILMVIRPKFLPDREKCVRQRGQLRNFRVSKQLFFVEIELRKSTRKWVNLVHTDLFVCTFPKLYVFYLQTKLLPNFKLSYSSNQITKKEPKSDARVSKFDWHDLSPIFLATMLLHILKVFQKPIKHHLLAIH